MDTGLDINHETTHSSWHTYKFNEKFLFVVRLFLMYCFLGFHVFSGKVREPPFEDLKQHQPMIS